MADREDPIVDPPPGGRIPPQAWWFFGAISTGDATFNATVIGAASEVIGTIQEDRTIEVTL